MVIALVFGTHGAGAGVVLNPEWLALAGVA